MKKEKDITTFEEYLDETYGKIGTKTRTDFDIKAKAFAIGEILKDERKQAKDDSGGTCKAYRDT